jgi:hypothetical protein
VSGPIVRKYGFPNFEKIFGERNLQHGSDEEAQADSSQQPASATPTKDTVDPTKPSSGGKVAPSTEFGATTE